MSKKKGFAALTIAGASMATIVMLQQRDLLPKIRVDVSLNHGKHEKKKEEILVPAE